MLSLDALQKTVARSVLGLPSFGLPPLLERGRADPQARLRIYRNNTRSSLTATLMAVFPVTVRLVDERFFRYAASEFVRSHPPREPRLVRYGAEFPAFLRTLNGLRDMPFVAETARLEWAIAEALEAPHLPARTLADLQGGDADAAPVFDLQPSLKLFVSHWPVLTIWSAHQDGREPAGLDMAARRSERFAIWKHADSIRFSRLDGAAFSFRYSLAHGVGLERAVARALTHDPMFDLAGAFVSLFSEGLVTAVRFPRRT
jgi:hypothetical protein